MFSFPNTHLKPGNATDLLKDHSIKIFHEAILWVWKLPYGRISNRSNCLLVPIEQKGSCSAKHAFLSQVASEQMIPLQLYIGIFMMNCENTPGIGSILEDYNLTALPEAHCYLKYKDKHYDFTVYENSTDPHPKLDFLYEEIISPNQIGNYKVHLHQKWMRRWAQELHLDFNFDQLWELREKCIQALSQR